MTKDCFEAHCVCIETRRTTCERRRGRQSAEARLSMSLSWLAGGSYLGMALCHAISVSIFFHLLDETICDLNAALKLKFRFRDERYLEEIIARFTREKSPILGRFGCINGIAIKSWSRLLPQRQIREHTITGKDSLHFTCRTCATAIPGLRLDRRCVQVSLMIPSLSPSQHCRDFWDVREMKNCF
jgi:hypothetical protein